VRRPHAMDIPRTLDEAVDAGPLALIVYDMQVGIVSQLAGGPAVVERVADLLDLARSAGMTVWFTRHMSLPLEAAGVAALRTAMAWQHLDGPDGLVVPFPRDSPQFQIVPELAPRSDEVIVDKITMSALAGTFLDIALRDCGIRTFLIAGIATEVGIEPTVRHACDLAYLPVVVTDACGHGNPEAARRSLDALAFAGGSLQTDTPTLRTALTAAHSRASTR
jgi:nicotinamidase-related amidase